MTRQYWDALAENYDDQIFSVIGHDCDGLIAERIQRYARLTGTAADLGCGPGQVTPLLARKFGRVHACDHSRRLLDQARDACAGLGNVHFHRHDLAGAKDLPFAPVDFVLCINVLLTPDLEVRERLWQAVSSMVATDGTLLLVLPSLESALYTNFRRLDWHVRAGLGGEAAIRQGLLQEGCVPMLEHGVRAIEGVETKHYLREEIIVQLADRGLRVEECIQLNYTWSTEFADPPPWLAAPFPWNWLVVATRPGEE
jgi:SAM-dependent methyltransferase